MNESNNKKEKKIHSMRWIFCEICVFTQCNYAVSTIFLMSRAPIQRGLANIAISVLFLNERKLNGIASKHRGRPSRLSPRY